MLEGFMDLVLRTKSWIRSGIDYVAPIMPLGVLPYYLGKFAPSILSATEITRRAAVPLFQYLFSADSFSSPSVPNIVSSSFCCLVAASTTMAIKQAGIFLGVFDQKQDVVHKVYNTASYAFTAASFVSLGLLQHTPSSAIEHIPGVKRVVKVFMIVLLTVLLQEREVTKQLQREVTKRLTRLYENNQNEINQKKSKTIIENFKPFHYDLIIWENLLSDYENLWQIASNKLPEPKNKSERIQKMLASLPGKKFFLKDLKERMQRSQNSLLKQLEGSKDHVLTLSQEDFALGQNYLKEVEAFPKRIEELKNVCDVYLRIAEAAQEVYIDTEENA